MSPGRAAPRRAAALLLVAVLAGACVASGLGAVKEALLYDKTTAETAYADAARANVRGQLSAERFAQVTTAYTQWRDAHLAAVRAVAAAEAAGQLGAPPSAPELARLRTAAANLLFHLLSLLQAYGVTK